MKGTGSDTRRRPVAVVLVDAEHKGLARPLCSDAALCQAIYDDICREDARALARAPWRLLGVGKAPAANHKEELRAKVASGVQAVFAGERPPPVGVPRMIDAASRELTALAEESGASVACQLFVTPSDAQENAPIAVVPALFGGVLPMRLAETWDAAVSQGAASGNIDRGAPPPTFSQVCAGGFRGATAVLVLSSRLLTTLQPLTEQLTKGEDAMPRFSWVHCAQTDSGDLNDVANLCRSYGGGLATSISTYAGLQEALRAAFGLPVASPVAEQPKQAIVERPGEMAEPNADTAPLLDSVEIAPELPRGSADSAYDGTFDVVWTKPGPLGLDFHPDSWVIGRSSKQDVCSGDTLVSVRSSSSNAVIASGPNAAPPGVVAEALMVQHRPLVLTFARRKHDACEDKRFFGFQISELSAQFKSHKPLSELSAQLKSHAPEDGRFFGLSVAAPLKLFAPPSRNSNGEVDGSQGVGTEVVDIVLSRHAEELQALDPEARRARIRELVANEMRHNHEYLVSAQIIDRALDARREPHQRISEEWLLILCRTLAFTGDPTTLCRASLTCRQWRNTLRHDGSHLALCLWKWSIRFGEPVMKNRRWLFWRWLLTSGGRALRRPSSRTNGAGLTLAEREAPDYYADRLERGRTDDALADARLVIAADLPRTFSGREENNDSAHQRLLPEAMNPRLSIEGRTEALDRILLAIAAERPSLGYCQGLDIVVALALSVAEEAGVAEESLEAETFSVVASLLDFECIASWMEPPLSGLRTAASALEVLLKERRPQLAAHLCCEGASVDLLGLAWLQTMFVGFAPMPRETLCRIWDCWLLDGTPKVFFRVALSLLEHAEGSLLGEPLERIAEILRNYSSPLDAELQTERLLRSAWAVKVTNSTLRRALSTAALEREQETTQELGEPGDSCVLASEPFQDGGLSEEECELEEAMPDSPKKMWMANGELEEELA